jgi:biopolymer transport protein ExbB
LGTVAGLIRAFHDTTKLTAGQNRADFLAVGIYEALVTTLAGLMVAIPAAVASHYFEGRIGRIFRDIEELTGQLVRRLGGFESKSSDISLDRDSPATIPPPISAGR